MTLKNIDKLLKIWYNKSYIFKTKEKDNKNERRKFTSLYGRQRDPSEGSGADH